MVTNNLISDVLIPHPKNLRWRICETGAGCPVASAILKTEGASKIIYDTHVPYGKDAQEDAGYMVDSPRAISLDFCANVIARKSANANANAVFVSTFQVGENKTTHGWIGISFDGFCRYYHVTLGIGIPRKQAIRRIGDIGVILMSNALMADVWEPLEVDDIRDERGNPVWEELLNSENSFATVLEQYGYVDGNDKMQYSIRPQRLEKYRDCDHLVVMPGSFNPLHEGHEELMSRTMDWVNDLEGESGAAYCITLNNFNRDKNPTPRQVLERATKIVLKHDLIVTDSPALKDFLKFNKRIGCHIHVPVGWDTFMRMENELFEDSRYDCITWHLFDRDYQIKHYREKGTETAKQVIRNLEANKRVVLHEDREHMTVSSTQIRHNNERT